MSPVPTRRMRVTDNNKKAMKELLEGRNAIVKLQALLQRGRWPDESSKELAAFICKDVRQIFDEGISCIDNKINRARPEGVADSDMPKETVTVADEFKWRKYGTRKIARAGQSRSYYRCARNGCPARKIEQQHESMNPSQLEITYRNSHTCNISMPRTASHSISPMLNQNGTDIQRVHQNPADSSSPVSTAQQSDVYSDCCSSSISMLKSDATSSRKVVQMTMSHLKNKV